MNEGSESSVLLQAISFAARAHRGQLRKDAATPYAAHPMRVMTVMALVFQVKDLALLTTALLHDTIEDTTTDFDDLEDQFSSEVARNVALLTKDMRLPEAEREPAYFAGLASAPLGVQLCKLADTYDNLVDSAGLEPASREKAVRKAKELVRLLHDQLVHEWPHVLDAVVRQIERTQALN